MFFWFAGCAGFSLALPRAGPQNAAWRRHELLDCCSGAVATPGADSFFEGLEMPSTKPACHAHFSFQAAAEHKKPPSLMIPLISEPCLGLAWSR